MNLLKMTPIFAALFSISLLTVANGQVSGNLVYGNNYNYGSNSNSHPQKMGIITTDSTLIVNVKLLLNKEADSYVVTIGLNQEAATVTECNGLINKRITDLQTALKPFDIEPKDVYVDFISQTKIYGYEMGKNQAQQVETGYEIKKNLLIRVKQIDYIDQLMELAAKQEIYDIIKVEYIDADIDKTYNTLFNEALALIKTRKERYLAACSLKLTGSSRILGDNFYAVAPKTQYQQYQAFESSSLSVFSDDSNPYVRSEARKQKTFYYSGIQTTDFDKILNADVPKIGLQYVLSLSMIYPIEREK